MTQNCGYWMIKGDINEKVPRYNLYNYLSYEFIVYWSANST